MSEKDVSPQYEENAIEFVNEWQTGALFLFLVCVAAIVGLTVGSTLGAGGAAVGFFGGGILGFLLLSNTAYGQ